MSESLLYLGENPLKSTAAKSAGSMIKFRGEPYFKISHSDTMPAFFMSVVSNGDHWLFIGSNGGLTAGRRNPQSAIFPYYTHDKLIENAENTGSKTLVKLHRNGRSLLWEPFSEFGRGVYQCERHLYKNRIGNKLRFEEINHDLQLRFSYEWSFSDRHGLVREAELENMADEAMALSVLDGLQNILPSGVNSDLQGQRSNLVDAYKKCELQPDTGLAIYSLSAMIIDRAEPSEALRANTLWSHGLEVKNYLLSSEQLMGYRMGQELRQENSRKARKGAYFIESDLKLEAGEQRHWWLVAEVDQSTAAAIDLQESLGNKDQLLEELKEDIEQGSKDLRRKVAVADGLQMTSDSMSNSRHFSNVLFNIMRGGLFEQEYSLSVRDLQHYLKGVNRPLYTQHQAFLAALPRRISYPQLLKEAAAQNDIDLLRICREYLPLSFSRRHGDPSRPWNSFNIDITDEKGEPTCHYEGNWRDIFQNWEALAYSFPAFVEGMISKFVNASTIDGYNPYRISRDGIDWETHEPDDPWSYIGYWGDHQLIYLLKLLEHSEKHYPGKLASLLSTEGFVYANVPYRIRGHAAITENPSDTIDYDHELAREADKRWHRLGADGKLVFKQQEQLLRANLAEKILVTMLTKMYNLVPDGGIWLNTQRPEWNDANNALVGNGLSVVTLAYLRRFVLFSRQLFKQLEGGELEMHKAVSDLALRIKETYEEAVEAGTDGFAPGQLRQVIDRLGEAGEDYRQKAYAGFSEGTDRLSLSTLDELFAVALQLIDRSLQRNRRKDALYHSYNLLELKDGQATIAPLYEMLEGQVAILSSGLLTAKEALQVLDALKNSAMYRSDQYSYLLYPDRELSDFLHKNDIPPHLLADHELLDRLQQLEGQKLLEWDQLGQVHFGGDMHNAADLKKEFARLEEEGTPVSDSDQDQLLQAYEAVFDHKSFTGRSGTFFGYEGLGSIYWHMVSKLLLAVAENIYRAEEEKASSELLGRLTEHYYEIRAGIGLNKAPSLYGAFPTDAYSHTPAHAGAQQPGMTGQVKEDILSRWAELGVEVKDGCLNFSSLLLRAEEFLTREERFKVVNKAGVREELEVPANSLAFTYCQLPVIYRKGAEEGLEIHHQDGSFEAMTGARLKREHSQAIFNRDDKLKHLVVTLAPSEKR